MDVTMDGLTQFAKASNLTTMCTILVILMTLDIITGLTAAMINGDASSTRMKSGLARKLLEFVMVFVAILMQFVYPPLWSGTLMAAYYCVAEALSIIEKCKMAGVPMPQEFVNRLSKLNGSEEHKHDRASLMNVNINKVEANMPPGTVMPVVVPASPSDSSILRESLHDPAA